MDSEMMNIEFQGLFGSISLLNPQYKKSQNLVLLITEMQYFPFFSLPNQVSNPNLGLLLAFCLPLVPGPKRISREEVGRCHCHLRSQFHTEDGVSPKGCWGLGQELKACL